MAPAGFVLSDGDSLGTAVAAGATVAAATGALVACGAEGADVATGSAGADPPHAAIVTMVNSSAAATNILSLFRTRVISLPPCDYV